MLRKALEFKFHSKSLKTSNMQYDSHISLWTNEWINLKSTRTKSVYRSLWYMSWLVSELGFFHRTSWRHFHWLGPRKGPEVPYLSASWWGTDNWCFGIYKTKSKTMQLFKHIKTHKILRKYVHIHTTFWAELASALVSSLGLLDDDRAAASLFGPYNRLPVRIWCLSNNWRNPAMHPICFSISLSTWGSSVIPWRNFADIFANQM